MLHVMSSRRHGAPLRDALAMVPEVARDFVQSSLIPHFHHQLDKAAHPFDHPVALHLPHLQTAIFQHYGFLWWRRSRAEGHQA